MGGSEPMPHGRVFGGQVLAQCVIAASRTVDDDRAVHSMHGYFLRPGDPDQEILFTVDRIHDGRSFAARRTQAFQDGEPIFSMIASFQRHEEGLEHFVPMPAGIPAPRTSPRSRTRMSFEHPLTRRLIQDRPVELRHVSAPIYLQPDPERSASQALWIRVRRPIGGRPDAARRGAGVHDRHLDPGADPAGARAGVVEPPAEAREPRHGAVVAPPRARG